MLAFGVYPYYYKHKEISFVARKGMVIKMTITKDTIIGDILDRDNSLAPIFLEIGMHCLGCPASRGETVEEACAVHGVDCGELLAKLNAKASV